MRKLLFLGAVFFAVSLQAENVAYNILFTPTTGSLTPTGSFTYDTTANQFVSFTVQGAGLSFDITSSANNPGTFPGCFPSADAAGFLSYLQTGGSGCQSGDRWLMTVSSLSAVSFGAPNLPQVGFRGPVGQVLSTPSITSDSFSSGTFSVAQVVPEPASVAMFGVAAVVLLGLSRGHRWTRIRHRCVG